MARAMVLAALRDGPTTVHQPLVARDSLLMAGALRALGSRVDTPDDGPWCVVPGRSDAPATIDCGLSGTVMRFVPPLAALSSAPVRFDGDPAARRRPMRPLLDALTALQVDLDPREATSLPFTLHGTGTVSGGRVTVDASASSQVVSGLLLAACRFAGGLTLRAQSAPPSRPHIEMTVAMLRQAGIDVTARADEWTVAPGVPSGSEYTIEPDLSNAAPFLAAAVVTGGRIHVPGWPTRSLQPGGQLLGVLRAFGAQTEHTDGALTITGPRRPRGLGRVDLGSISELVPTVTAIAALADSPTEIVGVGHIRGHETDRLAALARSLRGLGGAAAATADGLVITPNRLHGGVLASEGDHRMATFGAILGLRVPSVLVDDVGVTAKTMPAFPQMWQDMLS
jgi:3-phosphoshikimate 1-carboxyvinyltransferase